MRESFDRRVLSEAALELVRVCQRRVLCHLGGGAALAGAFLSHRLSRDIESLADLRASKLTCILSRSEPRDLVDLLFLERAGFPPEGDLDIALKKDAGIDPGILAWLLHRFPVEPLPDTLEPLDTAELRAYRDELAERLRQLATSTRSLQRHEAAPARR